MPESTTLVRAYIERGVGRVLLDRPAALNALTLGMVQELTAILESWQTEPLSSVFLESSSSRAFCAGGDIRAIRENTLSGDTDASEAFFSAEYRLNHLLATFAHPVISFIDGICMGGGLGLSVHGRFRVLTERAVLAMPETAIGFFPDVGASYFLSRLPGGMGMYLGLTGAQIGADDAVYSGLGTHRSAWADLPEIVEELTTRGRNPIDAVLRRFAVRAQSPTPLAQHRAEIDWCFGAPTIEIVKDRLTETDSNWSREQLATLARLSPQSLDVTFGLVTQGRQRGLAECLRAELAMTRLITTSHDFIEGVRAALVDKDRNPVWASAGTPADGSTVGLLT